MSIKAVVAVAFAAIFASALSIGITEYRSSTAHQDFLQAEKRRKLWEFKHCREKEMAAVTSLNIILLFCRRVYSLMGCLLYSIVDGDSI